jgi:hypothetical protein
MTSGKLRTRTTAITQLANVNKGTTKGNREELSKTNGSYICEALLPIALHQICFATLLVVLGVQISLLKRLTQRLRHHGTSCLSEVSLLMEGPDFLFLNIAENQQWRDFYEKDYKVAEGQRKGNYPLYLPAAKDKTMNEVDRQEL